MSPYVGVEQQLWSPGMIVFAYQPYQYGDNKNLQPGIAEFQN